MEDGGGCCVIIIAILQLLDSLLHLLELGELVLDGLFLHCCLVFLRLDLVLGAPSFCANFQEIDTNAIVGYNRENEESVEVASRERMKRYLLETSVDVAKAAAISGSMLIISYCFMVMSLFLVSTNNLTQVLKSSPMTL